MHKLAFAFALLSIGSLHFIQISERAVKDELLAADRAFAKAAAEKGLDGWMSFMAEDVAKVARPGQKILSGKEAIRKQDEPIFADPNRRLVWEPVDAHAFADGKTGLTSGRYRVVGMEDGKEKVFSTGGYITWWRKSAQHQWQVIFDTGAPDRPAGS